MHFKLQEIFIRKYRECTGEDYHWSGKDWGQLKLLVKQLEVRIEKKSGRKPDSEAVCQAFELIVDSIIAIPELKWYKSNLSIAIINSKLNEIVATVRNGKSNRQQNISSDISDYFKRAKT